MNTEERIKILRLFQDFEDLFSGTIGDWETETVNI